MNRFFNDLGERWVAAAHRRAAEIEAPSLDAKVALELLELARVAAHTQERRFAPPSTGSSVPEIEDARARASDHPRWIHRFTPAFTRLRPSDLVIDTSSAFPPNTATGRLGKSWRQLGGLGDEMGCCRGRGTGLGGGVRT
jgi:hypothetical protein